MHCGQSSSSLKNKEEKIAGVSKKYDEGQTRSISGDEERLKGKKQKHWYLDLKKRNLTKKKCPKFNYKCSHFLDILFLFNICPTFESTER